jgi:hypothetical protein
MFNFVPNVCPGNAHVSKVVDERIKAKITQLDP